MLPGAGGGHHLGASWLHFATFVHNGVDYFYDPDADFVDDVPQYIYRAVAPDDNARFSKGDNIRSSANYAAAADGVERYKKAEKDGVADCLERHVGNWKVVLDRHLKANPGPARPPGRLEVRRRAQQKVWPEKGRLPNGELQQNH
ncbi:hypothetical protein DFJ73DRAFT_763442 [Zopfochytrium polystomum]|nr:hypothetical protein DFJ73DRAFT_763442 [Zopfochytrium polystomum]